MTIIIQIISHQISEFIIIKMKKFSTFRTIIKMFFSTLLFFVKIISLSLSFNSIMYFFFFKENFALFFIFALHNLF